MRNQRWRLHVYRRVNVTERILRTKRPPLISCLAWVNVRRMLGVFPDGFAVCMQNTGNKTSHSSSIQPFSKPRLPFFCSTWVIGHLPNKAIELLLFISASPKQIISLDDKFPLQLIYVMSLALFGSLTRDYVFTRLPEWATMATVTTTQPTNGIWILKTKPISTK